MGAAQLLVSSRRCRSEAAFAALAGASPLQASSGKITRHRLNRFGDRKLNRALHVIVNWRILPYAKTKEGTPQEHAAPGTASSAHSRRPQAYCRCRRLRGAGRTQQTRGLRPLASHPHPAHHEGRGKDGCYAQAGHERLAGHAAGHG